MRTILIFLITVLFSNIVIGQSNYQEAIQLGDQAFNDGEYQEAIQKYFAAEAFDPSKKEVIQARIDKVFGKIIDLREEAEQAKKDAQLKTQEALDARRLSDSLLNLTQELADKEIESLRQTQMMQDSVRRVGEKIKKVQTEADLRIQLKDYETRAQSETERDNLAEALDYYYKSFDIIGKIEKRDSALIRRIELLNEKKTHLERYRAIFERTDSLWNQAKNYPQAYYTLLEAKNFPYRKDLVNTIKNLEKKLLVQGKELNDLPYEQYQELMALSAESAKIYASKTEVKARVKKAIKHRPYAYNFIRDPIIKEYAEQYDREFLRRLKIYIGIHGSFGAQSLSDPFAIRSKGEEITYDKPAASRWNEISFGISFDLGERISIGLGLVTGPKSSSLNQIDLDIDMDYLSYSFEPVETFYYNSAWDYIDVKAFDFVTNSNVRLYGLYTIFDSNLSKRRPHRKSFKIQGLLGVEGFKDHDANLNIRLTRNYENILPKPEGSGEGSSLFNDGFILYPILWPEGSDQFLITNIENDYFFDEDVFKINAILGSVISVKPFSSLPQIGLFGELTRKFNLNYVSKQDPISLNEIVDRDAESFFSGWANGAKSEEYSLWMRDQYDRFWRDEDIEIEISRRQFIHGWSLSFGAFLDF